MWCLSLLFAAGALAAPRNPLVVHEKRAISRFNSHEGRSERIDPSAIIPVRIALTQSNLDEGYDHLMRISDPNSESYGKHWSIEEIHEYFAPSNETIEAVKAWLVSAGIKVEDILESTSKGWLGADISAGDAERLFATEYYEHEDVNGKLDVGCDRYHVPSHLSSHIDYITPGIGAAAFEKTTLRRRSISQHERRALLTHCGSVTTPACIKALYDIPAAKYNQPVNDLGVYEDYYDVYDQADLNSFFARYAPNVPTGTHPKLVSINGFTAPAPVKSGGPESVIDFDLAFSILYPQSIILYQGGPTSQERKEWRAQVPGHGPNKGSYVNTRSLWENLLDAVDGSFCSQADKAAGADCGTVELTRVLSTSYGGPELIQPEALLKRACNAYMKLGLKGHTIVFSSGDFGPAGRNGCVDPDNIENQFIDGPVFNPQFPASCPYVLTVGATQLNANESVNDPETALYQPELANSKTAIFGSSGGFSNYFAEPGYQKSAVSTYLAKYNPGYPTYVFKGKSSVGANGGLYAKGGRAFPDVSANGANLPAFTDGEPPITGLSFGTSLSTPIWASLITMVNQERTLAGKGPVGFINPVLYAHTEIFTDITRGSVPGCGTPGFSTEPGWDPVTGLGTPIYPELLKVFLSLP